MTGFKPPSFDERMAASKAAKLKALAKLRRAAPSTQPTAATDNAPASPREIAAAERRAAHRAAIEQDKAARAEARAQAAAAAQERATVRKPALPTAEERKAARDARYAARKLRTRR